MQVDDRADRVEARPGAGADRRGGAGTGRERPTGCSASLARRRGPTPSASATATTAAARTSLPPPRRRRAGRHRRVPARRHARDGRHRHVSGRQPRRSRHRRLSGDAVPPTPRSGRSCRSRSHGPAATPLGAAEVVVGEFPAVRGRATVGPSCRPSRHRRRRHSAARARPRLVTFAAKKGERLIVEVHARPARVAGRSGPRSPRRRGQAGPAGDRSAARPRRTSPSATTTRPARHPPGDWNELAIDDYLYVGGELMRIQALPRNPDDDCQFYAGRRPAGRVPRHDADAPQPWARRCTRSSPPAGHDVPAERAAGVPARTTATTTAAPGYGKDSRRRLRPAGRRRVPGPGRRRPRARAGRPTPTA